MLETNVRGSFSKNLFYVFTAFSISADCKIKYAHMFC